MARVVSTYKFKTERAKGGPGRPAVYPWDRWTDGRVWKATEGVDFQTARNVFRSTLANRAVRTGYTVKIDSVDGPKGSRSVVFQFTPKKQLSTPKKRAAKKATRRTRKAATNG